MPFSGELLPATNPPTHTHLQPHQGRLVHTPCHVHLCCTMALAGSELQELVADVVVSPPSSSLHLPCLSQPLPPPAPFTGVGDGRRQEGRWQVVPGSCRRRLLCYHMQGREEVLPCRRWALRGSSRNRAEPEWPIGMAGQPGRWRPTCKHRWGWAREARRKVRSLHHSGKRSGLEIPADLVGASECPCIGGLFGKHRR